MKIEIVELVWKPHPWSDEVTKVFDSWLNTPYRDHQQIPGIGANCITWYCGALDVLFKWPSFKVPALPKDVSVHKPLIAYKQLRIILDHYPHEIIEGNEVEPGDAIYSGPKKGGPGHLYGVRSETNTLQHATENSGVCKTGCGYNPVEQQEFKIIRILEKERWRAS